MILLICRHKNEFLFRNNGSPFNRLTQNILTTYINPRSQTQIQSLILRMYKPIP